ncbi:hypothetical protein [Desulfofundulus thermosubterraneus]|uniref:Uncharacterized protein n=1 Tax=Desulfofundulus thermosubterraneus DSM 16057 TaxID=1121432 RepID=A0A1M6MC39_9FIRM|nr:hypothetical protein [Desulfofundulus thermosubterraneus]SHJ80995.1 hypothetical protein SAMN02745219_03392 [Desulfofundulus thermosubterraneus DSM 16057]
MQKQQSFVPEQVEKFLTKNWWEKVYKNLPLKTHGLVPWDERGVAR